MEPVLLALAVSLLLNMFFLRWALQEHAARRQWQKEAGALQRALRSFDSSQPAGTNEGAIRLFWLIFVGLFAGVGALILTIF